MKWCWIKFQDKFSKHLVLDETSDIHMVSLLATVVRDQYIYDGKIQERAIGFTNSADKFWWYFQSCTECSSKGNLEPKLVAQMYDGVSIMSTYLNKVLEAYSRTFHVHWYAYLVLSQNLKNIQECSTNLLQHIFSAHWTFCVLVTKELMRLLTINLNLITQNTVWTYVLTEHLKRKIPS
jgi:hypothetical protein